jgi:hypothetical protein
LYFGLQTNAPENNNIGSPSRFEDENYGAIERRKRAKRRT